MTTEQVARELVRLCRAGENEQAIRTLYSPEIVSIEAMEMPGWPAEQCGMDAILKKTGQWCSENEVHSGSVSEPVVSEGHFAVVFDYDVTHKPTARRMRMSELAVYAVTEGKITREQFFYKTDGM